MADRGRPAKQRERIIRYVRDTIASDGQAPSYGMICSALGIRTRQEVCRIVGEAERLGQLKRVGSGKVRRLQLVHA